MHSPSLVIVVPERLVCPGDPGGTRCPRLLASRDAGVLERPFLLQPVRLLVLHGAIWCSASSLVLLSPKGCCSADDILGCPGISTSKEVDPPGSGVPTQPDPLLCVETGSLIFWEDDNAVPHDVVPSGSGEPMYRNPLLCMETGLC